MRTPRPGWTSRHRLVARTTVLLVVLAAVTAGSLGAGSASASGGDGAAVRPASGSASAPAPTSGRPTVVLVHGAFADATGWSAEVTALRALGYPVLAPADPLRGVTSDADYLRSVLLTVPGPIVLVGHSYGGTVITNAARGVPNVKALVYVAAFVPDEGESLLTSYDATTYPGALLGPATTEVRPAPNAAATGGQDLDVYIRADAFRAVFAGDQSASTALTMAATQRPLALTANLEPSGAPAWKDVPSWDLVTLDDHAIAPGGQLFMARRAHARISTVHSAHDVMVSHPAAVLKTILAAAAQVS